jgi:TolB-like protein/tetratricopeptide (TPR) repeat protein
MKKLSVSESLQSVTYRFGDFSLEVAERRLMHNGRAVSLTPKAFDTLSVLVRSHGKLVDKNALMRRVWPDTFVTTVSLARNISVLRKILGEDAIETVAKFGYRFCLPVGMESGARLTAPKPSIAVLPFVCVGDEDRYLEFGLADAIITRLSNLRQIAVRPTSSVRQYVGARPDPLQVGRELRVDWIIEGAIHIFGERIRVTVQLINATDPKPMWAETFDEPLGNIFAIQDSISEHTSVALLRTVTEQDLRPVMKRTTESVKAHQAYLKGRYAWNSRTRTGLETAAHHYRQAITIDSRYALAYSGLADCHLSLVEHVGASLSESLARAKAAAERAVAIDPDLAEGHVSLAIAALYCDWDFARAEAAFARALPLKPNYAHGRHWHSQYLLTVGRFAEALAEVRLALEIDPFSLIINTHLGYLLYAMGDYETAVEQFHDTLDLDANFIPALRWMGTGHSKLGKHAGALATLEKAAALDPDNPRVLSKLGCACARANRTDATHDILRRLDALATRRYVSPMERAYVFMALDDLDAAFAALAAAAERHPDLLLLDLEPEFHRLRADPRFDALRNALGLERRCGEIPHFSLL